MGLMDKLKGLMGQGSKVAADHKDTIHDGVDKAADLANDKTGGKHADKVDKASDAVKDTVNKIADSGDGSSS
jgi:hypothetical protein